MKKWYREDYTFEIEAIGLLHSDRTEGYCRNSEEIGELSGQYTGAGNLL